MRTWGIPNLVAANQRRHRAGCAVQFLTVEADLDILGGAVPGHLLAAGLARLRYPDDTLAQLGARLGVTKDVVASQLRRLHEMAERERKKATT